MRVRTLFVATLSACLLAACGDGTPDPEAGETAAETPATDPEAPAGITLSDASVQLSAVTGNPGVAYFTIASEADEAMTIAAVYVEGVGRTEMHETYQEGEATRMRPVSEVTVEPGQTFEFEHGGHHVMLFDVGQNLTAGSTTELTVTFADGDKASIAADVSAAGGAMAGMEETDAAH